LARPLLILRREETLRYCRESSIAPREDPTNEMLLAARNRIRHEVLLGLRTLNPSVEVALARLAETVYEDAAELERQAEVAFARVGRRERELVALKLGELSELSPAIQRRVLRLAVEEVLGSRADIASAHVEAVSRLVVSRPGRVSLPRGLVAVRNSRMLTVRRGDPTTTPPIPETELAVPGVTEAGRWRFEVEYAPRGPGRQRVNSEAYLSCETAAEGLRVRSRRPGDRMRPAGLGGTKKLQDILVDAKVPRGERDGVPVLVAGGRVAWVVGLAVDERAGASAGGTCVRIRALKRPANTEN
jgi:tRNA(Ile)-lysidine synthetase-like protein